MCAKSFKARFPLRKLNRKTQRQKDVHGRREKSRRRSRRGKGKR